MNTIDFQYGLFLVDERAFCLWDQDVKKINLDFLNDIDPEYFEYLADVNFEKLGDEKEETHQYAALAIRTAFSQGLETLFALLFASIQAPHCVPAWMNLYKNNELYSLVRKINEYKKINSLLKVQVLNWSTISEAIYEALLLDDKEKESTIKRGFGQLWSRFAAIFLQDDFGNEYNSIKHGLRIRTGGFSFAMGVQDAPGIPAPKERMMLMGKSKFGTSYYDINRIGSMKEHVQIRRNSRNWDPEDMVWGLKLISISISNVISALKIHNGIKPDDVQFHWPSDLESFNGPWKRSRTLGVTSMTGFGLILPPQLEAEFSKDEIIQNYLKDKILGIKRYQIDDLK